MLLTLKVTALYLFILTVTRVYGAVFRYPDHYYDYSIYDSYNPEDESCQEPEPEPERTCNLRPADEFDSYMELVPGHGWIKRACAKGSAFSAENCGCTIMLEADGDSSSSSSEEDCEAPEPVPCTRKPTSEREYYLQLVEGRGWIEQRCAEGTAYNQPDCSCTITLAQEDRDSGNDYGDNDSSESEGRVSSTPPEFRVMRKYENIIRSYARNEPEPEEDSSSEAGDYDDSVIDILRNLLAKTIEKRNRRTDYGRHSAPRYGSSSDSRDDDSSSYSGYGGRESYGRFKQPRRVPSYGEYDSNKHTHDVYSK